MFNQFPGVVRVETRDGRRLEERVMTTRGGPEQPLSQAELESKLTDNAGRLAVGIARACRELDQLTTVEPVLAATRT